MNELLENYLQSKIKDASISLMEYQYLPETANCKVRYLASFDNDNNEEVKSNINLWELLYYVYTKQIINQ